MDYDYSGLESFIGPGFVLFGISFSAFVIGYLVYYHRKIYKTYNSTPTYEEYRALNPTLVNRGRVECSNCGSERQYVRGLYGANDNRKTHFCATCSKPLYRATSH